MKTMWKIPRRQAPPYLSAALRALDHVRGSERLPLCLGKAKNVRSSSPLSRKLMTTPGQRLAQVRSKAAYAVRVRRRHWWRRRSDGSRRGSRRAHAWVPCARGCAACARSTAAPPPAATPRPRRVGGPGFPSTMPSNGARDPRAARSSRQPFHAAYDSPPQGRGQGAACPGPTGRRRGLCVCTSVVQAPGREISVGSFSATRPLFRSMLTG
jgi:hypothetical protein